LGWMYVRFFYGVRKHLFERLPVPGFVVPALGGLVVGAIALAYPQVLGTGETYLQELMSGAHAGLAWPDALRIFATIAVLKVIATTCTVGAGASGGVFAPSLFIGGMLGAFVGTVGQLLFPETITSLAPFVLVGMGAFFAGIANAPLASLIMVSEMTGGYELLAPMLAVGILALVLNRRWSIYEKQVTNRFESPAHLWDMRIDILRGNRIVDAIKELSQRSIVRNDMLLFSLNARAAELHETDFIVVDEDRHYVGAVSLRHLVLSEPDPFLRNIVNLDDLATQTPTVGIHGSLGDALTELLKADLDKVAVVEGDKVLGYVTMREILQAYEIVVNRRPQ